MLDIHEDGFLFPHALASKQPVPTRIVSVCFRTPTSRILTQASFLLVVLSSGSQTGTRLRCTLIVHRDY